MQQLSRLKKQLVTIRVQLQGQFACAAAAATATVASSIPSKAALHLQGHLRKTLMLKDPLEGWELDPEKQAEEGTD